MAANYADARHLSDHGALKYSDKTFVAGQAAIAPCPEAKTYLSSRKFYKIGFDMENVVLTIHLLLALALIALVLLQRSEGGGLGLGGGGGGDGVMSGRAAASALTKLTWIFAVAFIITSLTLTAIAARKSAGSSVIDRLGGASAVQSEQQGDALDTDALLPPTAPAEAPLVPSAD